jgi:uncharacterized protein YqjF (DUF2071 family)
MSKIFLTAQWRNLLMANYAIDPAILKPYVPCHTELDDFEGVHYVSLVGFLFQDVRLRGIAVPFHTTFEEVNLRFYVRCKEAGGWKRGVVFLKEIVPRRAITFVANKLYNENYATHEMKHCWETAGGELHISYEWKVGKEWNFLKAVAAAEAAPIATGTIEEFITEHYWGYTAVSDRCTGVYQVTHPRWNIHAVKKHDIRCNAERLYGTRFAAAFSQAPMSVFLADGSAVEVYTGSKLIKQES